MPSRGNQRPEQSGNGWLGILRILLVQILVLLALSGAIVRYLNWSSDAAWAEFSRANGTAAPGAKSHPPSAMPPQIAKAQPPRGWRV